MAKPDKAPVTIQEIRVSSLAVATSTIGGERKYTRDMTKRLIAVLLVTSTLALVHLAQAQQQSKQFKIGWLLNRPNQPNIDDLKKALRALGYTEGKNIIFEIRFSEGKLDRFPALADELIRLKVDLIIANLTTAALAAKKATQTIPIVFTSGGDPVTVGLVDSLAHPGGNLTGFSNMTSELAGKRLELLKETVPKLTHVAVLWEPRSVASAQDWKESLYPARELGLQLHGVEVSSADQLESAFKEAIKTRSAALVVTLSAINNANPKRIADLAVKHRLPAISRGGNFVASGGMMSYAADQAEQPKRVAYLIDKILKGSKPADLPVERPTTFQLMINLKTAGALNLTIPPLVLMRATKVIK